MSLLKSIGSLFEAKPGGSDAGNLLRNAVSDLTGGILGQGAMMPRADGTKPGFWQTIGKQAGAILGGGLPALAALGKDAGSTSGSFQDNVNAGAKEGVLSIAKKWVLPVLVALGGFAAVLLFVKRKKKK